MATTRLHVAGLAPNTSADDLRQLFAGVARVARVTIPPPRDPQLPRGYAFVEVKNAADADACVAAYDNATWRGGRKLAVARARPDFKRRRELERDDEEAALAKSADARADRLRRRRVVVRPPPARRAPAFRGHVSTRFANVAPAPLAALDWGAVPRPAPRARSPRTVTSTPLPPEESESESDGGAATALAAPASPASPEAPESSESESDGGAPALRASPPAPAPRADSDDDGGPVDFEAERRQAQRIFEELLAPAAPAAPDDVAALRARVEAERRRVTALREADDGDSSESESSESDGDGAGPDAVAALRARVEEERRRVAALREDEDSSESESSESDGDAARESDPLETESESDDGAAREADAPAAMEESESESSGAAPAPPYARSAAAAARLARRGEERDSDTDESDAPPERAESESGDGAVATADDAAWEDALTAAAAPPPMRAASASDDDDAADEDEEPAEPPAAAPAPSAFSFGFGQAEEPAQPTDGGNVLPGTASWRALRDIFSTTKKKEFVGADGSSVALPFAAAGGAVAHSFGFDAEVEAAPEEEAPAPAPTKGTTGLWAGLDKAQALSLASLRAAQADASKLDEAWESEKDGLQQAYKKAYKKAAARKRRRLGEK